MTVYKKIKPLAESFMQASGFYGGGQHGSLGKKVIQKMNKEEQLEYGWDLPREDIHWAEFFSKVAIRQGRLKEVADLVPKDMIEEDTVSKVAQFSPQFAVVLSAAQINKS